MKNLYKIDDELYIISLSEKIKENTQSFKEGLNGDWFYNTVYNFIARTGDITPYDFKIILTTNSLLIADGIQEISEDFLQWFVKNSSCESVKGERLDTFKKTNEVYVDEIAGGNYYEIIKQYKIIIPQEETKQKACDNCNNDVCCCTIKKQETLEKVAKKQWGNVHRTGVLGFIDGVKSDAARDYWFEKFEEDLKTAYFSGIKTTGEGWNGEYANGNNPSIEKEFQEEFQEWLRHFKKK
jgi:hypothetical protein